MTMPRSLQEILEHADELERRFADHEPADVRDAEPLRTLRDAVTERAATERRISEPSLTPDRQACPGPPSAECSAPPARRPASATR